MNLFAFRSPHPKDLRTAVDAVGPANDETILRKCREARRVICAWGNGGGLLNRYLHVLDMLLDAGVQLECLGRTQDGHPKHPLARGKHRISADFEPIPYARLEVKA